MENPPQNILKWVIIEKYFENSLNVYFEIIIKVIIVMQKFFYKWTVYNAKNVIPATSAYSNSMYAFCRCIYQSDLSLYSRSIITR